MKLDLLNSRLVPAPSARVYDSLEGCEIRIPGPKNVLSSISFKSTEPKIKPPRKSCAPPIFDKANIDHRGNILDVTKELCKVAKNPLNKEGRFSTTGLVTVEAQAKNKLRADPKDPNNYMPTLDLIKDHILEYDVDTVEQRLNGGKLPGANWSDVSRFPEEPSHYTGNSYYDTERFEQSKYGGKNKTAVKFNDVPRSEDDKPTTPPIKERLRRKRAEEAQRKLRKTFSSSTLNGGDSSVFSFSSSLADSNSGASPTKRSVPVITFSEKDRWNDPLYKQESYTKTSGMKLSGDWHKVFDKKIPFSFNQNSYSKKSLPKEESDVDVVKYYSIVEEAKSSSVRYSAAFISKAKVGMEIPVPTSGELGGPGAFPGAFKSSVSLKNLKIHTRERDFPVKQALPEVMEKFKLFSEVHTRGPFVEQSGKSSKNAHMEKLVKDKLTQVYPRLAKKKFPPPPKVEKDTRFMVVKPPKRK